MIQIHIVNYHEYDYFKIALILYLFTIYFDYKKYSHFPFQIKNSLVYRIY